MELRAKQKKQQRRRAPRKTRPVTEPRKGQVSPPVKAGGYRSVLTIRCNTLLYNTIQNMIATSHTAQDFTYASPADFIRTALKSYQEGLPLTELEEKGEKIETTIRVAHALKEFYTSLPDRSRAKLLERAIRTFIKQHQ